MTVATFGDALSIPGFTGVGFNVAFATRKAAAAPRPTPMTSDVGSTLTAMALVGKLL
eukprot:CAMPEP_0181474242 /NCGR_PEP_ID=MMETSP1110-20121109/40547_1 /TAXON_ID=174948 /ORGANISM="Symbiodinium sp., Strain CCMP421" /LENGTH=56 /DNA_ID=CAMNT_0023599401 /DNA_START=286 /DNA_END=456 /DNA_ORIENTATION=+